jgi:hypothetical protein
VDQWLRVAPPEIAERADNIATRAPLEHGAAPLSDASHDPPAFAEPHGAAVLSETPCANRDAASGLLLGPFDIDRIRDRRRLAGIDKATKRILVLNDAISFRINPL